MTSFLSRLIHISKMLRNASMGIKAVNNIEQLGHLRSLLGQIGSRATAQHQYINFILMLSSFGNIIYRHTLGYHLYRSRVATSEHCYQLHICILSDSRLHTTT